MVEMVDSIIGIGIIALVAVCGLMGLVFLNYVKGVMVKMDSVAHIEPMLDKVNTLVEKVDKIVNKLALAEQRTDLELEIVKKRLDALEAYIDRLKEGK